MASTLTKAPTAQSSQFHHWTNNTNKTRIKQKFKHYNYMSTLSQDLMIKHL